MARKFDRQLKINTEVAKVLQDPMTLHYLAAKIIRKRPKYMPWFIWKALLLIVLAPDAKKKPQAQIPPHGR